MKIFFLILFGFLVTFFFLQVNDNSRLAQKRSIDDKSVVVLVVNNGYSLETGHFSNLLQCVWDDGYAVWSNNVAGGPPYFEGMVPKENVASLGMWVKTNGYLAIPDLQKHKLGPGSDYMSITLPRINGEEFEMCSWHENWEFNQEFVTLSDGPEKIHDNKSKLEVLKTDSKDYLLFRIAWLELRSRINQLLPSNGKSIAGKLDESNPRDRIWKPEIQKEGN